MTDVKDITPELDRLDSQLDDLEEAMKPLLGDLQEMSSQLPLLDKAKLYSLTAYAIESLLFCALAFPITLVQPEKKKKRKKGLLLTFENQLH